MADDNRDDGGGGSGYDYDECRYNVKGSYVFSPPILRKIIRYAYTIHI
ncbi:hypothetical protein HanXRQr2_Chr17g0780561 [Helianthus annuus]|uniref:Uncharacterized protein n=1 Tax=Helianthus annuus TaxID=4232 RepID=A0A9K3GST6_HELAN|nr:hypothetical protein HanXRQr2_Chr17g0780561 [Helianthus annuus]